MQRTLPHPDHPHLLCSEDGRIFNTRTRKLSRFPQFNEYGRIYVNGRMTLIHRLIAETWLANTEDLPTVHHINGDISDNRPSNLQWCTNKYNTQSINCKRGFTGGVQLTPQGMFRVRCQMIGSKRVSKNFKTGEEAMQALHRLQTLAMYLNYPDM